MKKMVCDHMDIEQVCKKAKMKPSEEGDYVDQ